jgi:hypothetical protein
MVILARTFGCDIGSMPFTYLDLSMGTTKPKIEDLTPIVVTLDPWPSHISIYRWEPLNQE